MKQQDKTCVPVVPQATEEQRETLHMKATGKHIETKIQYEVMLRHGDDEDNLYIVDVREDTVTLDGDPVTEEYIEGVTFTSDDYDEAKKKYLEMIAEYDTLDTEICAWNEIEDDE
jgi:lipopolysaccharide export LptBFGC system permease protein LptF